MEGLLELLRSSLPNAVGEIVAAVILAVAGAAVARVVKRRRRKAGRSRDSQERGAKAQGIGVGVIVRPHLTGQMLKRESLDVGRVELDSTLEAGLKASTATVSGQEGDLKVVVPGASIKVGSSERSEASDSSEGSEPHDSN